MPARPITTRVPAPRCRIGRAGIGGLRVAERYLTQVEAARMAGVSKDSVIRARRSGRLPGCRLTDGHWEIPASALAGAGLQPPASGETPPGAGDRLGDEAGDGQGAELAAAQARLAALQDLVARQDEELRFLRQLLAEAVTKAGRG